MEFRLLGRLEVEADGVDLTPGRPQQRALLTLLLLRVEAPVATDELVDALWGERPPETALTAIHGHISALRKRLGSHRIQTIWPGYALRLPKADTLDIRRFEELLANAVDVVDAAERASKLGEALGLFRGSPLADFRHEPFARVEAARLDELRLSAAEQKFEAEMELGRHADLVPRLELVVAEHPLRERARILLMLALYRAGRQADALHVAHQARLVLAEELGIEPGPALQLLEQQILNHDPRLAAPELFSPAARTKHPIQPRGIATFLSVRSAGEWTSPDRQGDAPGSTTRMDPDPLQSVAAAHGGQAISGDGASALFVFARVRDAAEAAAQVQALTFNRAINVRIGIHTAEIVPNDEGFSGQGARVAANVCAAAQQGQILLSRASRDLFRETLLDWADLRDLGDHRLQDLGPAQRLYQLVPPGTRVDFPPPRGLERMATNLPIQPTPLVGRGREIREVVAMMVNPGIRLVTLTGAGGSGKTRLALQCAAELLDEFRDGVYLVNLAPLTDVQLVLPTIARTLGVQETAGQTVEEALRRGLHGRQLLVLDNFEHLRAAGPLAAQLAEMASGLRLLATSRAALNVAGERAYAVPPLETPAPSVALDRLLAVESVALFAARARAARSDFAVVPENAPAVAELCRALDGLPLAIELAASRVDILPPAVLVERLSERLNILSAGRRATVDRHRTLEAAIGWSHDLLEPDERSLFMRLSVFVGGCSLTAAEEVCGAGIEVIDGLTALVDQSLVRVEGTDAVPRFTMLETIRHYAAARLGASPEAKAVSQRHIAYFQALAVQAEPHLRGSPGEWLGRLEIEHDNLRAALDRLEAAGESRRALELAGSLWRFWYLRGHLAEGRRRLEQALAADEAQTAARGKALIGSAVMAVNAGDVDAAVARSMEGLALHDRLDDAWGRAYSRFMLGAAVRGAGDLARAHQLLEQAVAEFRELNDEHSALLATRTLADTCDDLGDRERARELYEDSLRRARVTNNQRIQASTLGALAMIAYEEGRIQDALWMLKESLSIHRELADHLDTAVDLARAARALALAGRAGAAVRLLSSFDSVAQELGVRQSGVAALNKETLTSVRRQLDEAAMAEAWRMGRELTVDRALALAINALE
jgi:predicted ATPase/DNA-binding SARP family transcriptional activator